MKKNRLFYFILAMIVVAVYACNKDNTYNPQGGQLPTHYIEIGDSSFTPNIVTEANGSSFTFLNHSGIAHSIVSDDTFTMAKVTIQPDSFYYFKPDTTAATPIQIQIPYHCVEHPTARGVIILNP